MAKSRHSLDWNAIWREMDDWWEKHGGESWKRQQQAIQRIANKHVQRLLEQLG